MTAHPFVARPVAAPAAPGFSMHAVIGLAAGLLMAAWAGPLAQGLAHLATATGPAFVHGAVAGTGGARLMALPGGETVVATLQPGAVVAIAGSVTFVSGGRAKVAYWARYEGPAGVVHGFVAPGDLTLAGGEPPPMDLRRINAERSGAVAAAAADLGIAWLPVTVDRWSELILAAAERHGIDPRLVAIVVLVESGGDPSAKSPSGALGLMQVMPATGVDIATRRGLADFHVDDLLDPATNIDFGAWYLAQQLAAFSSHTAGGDPGEGAVPLAAAAYNGGPGHLLAHLGGGPLYAETARYQAWVTGMWRERVFPASESFQSWLSAGGERLILAAGDSGLE